MSKTRGRSGEITQLGRNWRQACCRDSVVRPPHRQVRPLSGPLRHVTTTDNVAACGKVISLLSLRGRPVSPPDSHTTDRRVPRRGTRSKCQKRENDLCSRIPNEAVAVPVPPLSQPNRHQKFVLQARNLAPPSTARILKALPSSKDPTERC